MSKKSFQEEFVKQMMLEGLEKYRDHIGNKIAYRMRGGSTNAAYGCHATEENAIEILDKNIRRIKRGIENHL